MGLSMGCTCKNHIKWYTYPLNYYAISVVCVYIYIYIYNMYVIYKCGLGPHNAACRLQAAGLTTVD